MADSVFVKVSNKANFLYGFPSRLDDTDKTTLGQTKYTSQPGVVFGVNSPKPARMKKETTGERSKSGFVSVDKRATATTSGWKLVKRARARGRTNTTLSTTVYVKIDIDGTIIVQYAWNMPKTTYDLIASDRASLKILDVSAAEEPFDLVFGGNFKPPRATNGLVSTFVGPDATLPTGWSMVGGAEE